MDTYEWIRSRRSSLALEIKANGGLVLRTPLALTKKEADLFVEDKSAWIEKKRKLLREAQAEWGGAPLSADARADLKANAFRDLRPRLEKYAEKMGLPVPPLGIRLQKTRWGSCSGRGRVSLNGLLLLAPETVRDYVVVHELAHLKEMNHSRAFWQEVEKALPGYQKERAWLKKNGHALMERIKS